MKEYDVTILMSMTFESLAADDEYWQASRNLVRAQRLCLTGQKREDLERRFDRVDAESTCRSRMLCDVCKMVGADVTTVLAVAKALNRYEKKQNWERCIIIDRDSPFQKGLRALFADSNA